MAIHTEGLPHDPEDSKAKLYYAGTRWFFAVVTLAYTTGYLIVSLFFGSRFGLSQITHEFLKLEYLYVGSIYLMLSFTLILPIYAFIIYRRYGDTLILDLPSWFLLVSVLIAFFVYGFFSPPGTFGKHWIALLFSFYLTVGGFVSSETAIERIQKYAKSQEEFSKFWSAISSIASERIYVRNMISILRAIVLSVIIIIYIYLFYQIYEFLWVVLKNGAFYLGLILLAGYIPLAIYNIAERSDKRDVRVFVWIVGIGVLSAFYYLSVVAFTLHVYVFIPENKGGGDYSHVTGVEFYLKEAMRDVLPDDYLIAKDNSTVITIPLVLLHRSPQAYYIAHPKSSGGAPSWRVKTRPPVREILRDTVLHVVYRKDKIY